MSGGSSSRRLTTLDAIRGICAILVMAMHSRFLTGYDPFPSAYLVVDIFFMMSGFVIAHAYDKKLHGGGYFRTFVWRRYSRLLPMWFLGLSAGTCFALVFRHRDPHLLETLALFLTELLFIPLPLFTPGSDDRYLFQHNSPGWSLFFEMAANLVYGLLAPRLTARMLGGIVVVGAVALATASWIHGDLDGGAIRGTAWIGLLRTIFGFSVGLLLYRMRDRLGAPFRAAWLFVTVMAVVVALSHFKPAADIRRLYDPAMVLFVCPAVVWLGIRVDTGAGRIAEMLGAISYPLYAIHFSIMLPLFFVWGHLTHYRADHMSGAVAFAICGVVLLIAYLLGTYVDPAAQRFAGRLLHRRPVETPSPAMVESN